MGPGETGAWRENGESSEIGGGVPYGEVDEGKQGVQGGASVVRGVFEAGCRESLGGGGSRDTGGGVQGFLG